MIGFLLFPSSLMCELTVFSLFMCLFFFFPVTHFMFCVFNVSQFLQSCFSWLFNFDGENALGTLLNHKILLFCLLISPIEALPLYFFSLLSLQLAQKELQKINMYKAPRDKLVCILNCCKVINNLLLNASIASNENPPGADEFLPVLIYVTLKV